MNHQAITPPERTHTLPPLGGVLPNGWRLIAASEPNYNLRVVIGLSTTNARQYATWIWNDSSASSNGNYHTNIADAVADYGDRCDGLGCTWRT